jgi:hypothetical protein
MHEIICPHCGQAFKIDEAGYADNIRETLAEAELNFSLGFEIWKN